LYDNIVAGPTILLVEEDNDVRPFLTQNLRLFGYHLLVSATSEDAFEWIRGKHELRADLVLVNLIGQRPEEALVIGRRLRDSANDGGDTPLIVLPETVPDYLEGVDERVSEFDWICYYEDAEQPRRLISSALSKSIKR
jgi:CheY-like chemotaxis protein